MMLASLVERMENCEKRWLRGGRREAESLLLAMFHREIPFPAASTPLDRMLLAIDMVFPRGFKGEDTKLSGLDELVCLREMG